MVVLDKQLNLEEAPALLAPVILLTTINVLQPLKVPHVETMANAQIVLLLTQLVPELQEAAIEAAVLSHLHLHQLHHLLKKIAITV